MSGKRIVLVVLALVGLLGCGSEPAQTETPALSYVVETPTRIAEPTPTPIPRDTRIKGPVAAATIPFPGPTSTRVPREDDSTRTIGKARHVTRVTSSGLALDASIFAVLIYVTPMLVFLAFGIWAIRHPDGGAVKAVGIVLTALGVIMAALLVATIVAAVYAVFILR